MSQTLMEGISKILLVGLVVAAMMLASGSVLILAGWCSGWLAFTAFGAVIVLIFGRRQAGPYESLCIGIAFLGAVWAGLRGEYVQVRLVILAWLLLGLDLVGKARRPGGRFGFDASVVILHWTALGYAGLLLWYDRSDDLWFMVRHLNDLTSVHTPLGVWIAGLPIYVFGLLALALGLAMGSQRISILKRFLIVASALPLSKVFLSVVAPLTAAKVSITHGLALALVSYVISGIRPKRPATVAVLVISVGLSLLAMSQPVTGLLDSRADATEPGPPSSIGLYTGGILDWGVPDSERVGLINGGMFGLFRKALENEARASGGEVIPIDSIAGCLGTRFRTLVFINPTIEPTRIEIAGLERFVRAGGSLLVLGDHTDIGGSRGPLNAILSFTSIHFNFDSAIPLRKNWQGCLELRDHPVTEGITRHVMLQISVGASLEVEAPAFPIVIARYGFSDHGDPMNEGWGAYMGNLRHEAEERVGDMVLVAGQVVGQGRVLVFGDTSPFQNAALFLSQGFVAKGLAWLHGAQGNGGRGEFEPASLRHGRHVATIDFSHVPDASLELFRDRSLGGLANCLARADVTPLPALTTDDWVPEASYFFMVGPTRDLTLKEKDWLLNYMSSGGNLIICQGYDPHQPCGGIMSELGISLGPVPLGGGDGSSRVTHKNAWPVFCGRPDTTVWATAFGHPTILTRPLGHGSLTVIGDSRFLLDENLESERGGSLKNINFTVRLSQTLRE